MCSVFNSLFLIPNVMPKILPCDSINNLDRDLIMISKLRKIFIMS